MPYVETPPSKRARIAWLLGAWVVAIGPFTVLFFMWGGVWFGLSALALALLRLPESGGFFEQIDSKDVAIGDRDWRIRRLF